VVRVVFWFSRRVKPVVAVVESSEREWVFEAMVVDREVWVWECNIWFMVPTAMRSRKWSSLQRARRRVGWGRCGGGMSKGRGIATGAAGFQEWK
jgi:hypothetical protein